jgi:hypothetical protein
MLGRKYPLLPLLCSVTEATWGEFSFGSKTAVNPDSAAAGGCQLSVLPGSLLKGDLSSDPCGCHRTPSTISKRGQRCCPSQQHIHMTS